eukprot:TRINITY_DN49904_c0_g1_i1.p1 TRINITY_DN49904_c0_g1~~TRINITY_DN49904_c0_g1_i1.p1  ORF type:complete len:118 (+),score=23.74 TRINITY_DN49904_c0_g1_i1:64-417(+)
MVNYWLPLLAFSCSFSGALCTCKHDECTLFDSDDLEMELAEAQLNAKAYLDGKRVEAESNSLRVRGPSLLQTKSKTTKSSLGHISESERSVFAEPPSAVTNENRNFNPFAPDPALMK